MRRLNKIAAVLTALFHIVMHPSLSRGSSRVPRGKTAQQLLQPITGIMAFLL